MKKALIVIVGLLLVGGIVGLNSLRTGKGGESLLHVAPAAAMPVVVVVPERKRIVRRVQAPGAVEAVSAVEISSEIPAKIEEMPYGEGDLVEAGNMICRLNDDEYRAGVASGEAAVGRLKAAIRQAEADLGKCQRDCARQERLIRIDAASDTEVEDYKTALVKAEATLEIRKQELAEAEAMLQRARDALSKTIITAPISGTISEVFAQPGEIVITGTMNNPGTVIMNITDLSRMMVRARVDETDIPLVHPDQPADIFLPSDPQRAIPGRILRVATAGTKQTGRDVVTFETLVLVESDDSTVKPGMTANVEIAVAEKEDALTVPVQAVVHRKRKDLPKEMVEAFEKEEQETEVGSRHAKAQYMKVVFTKNDDKSVLHLVRTGIADERYVEILDGVKPGNEVIVGPYRTLDQLKHDTVIKLDEQEETKGDASGEATGTEPDDEQAADEPGDQGSNGAVAQND